MTLIEAMLLMVVLSIVAVAAAGALQTLVRTGPANNQRLVIMSLLTDRMEAARATAFANLALGASTDVVQGYRRQITVSLCDADGDGRPENDCKQITVTLSDADNKLLQSLTTVVTDLAGGGS